MCLVGDKEGLGRLREVTVMIIGRKKQRRKKKNEDGGNDG